MDPDANVRLAIVDDHKMVRDGLRAAIGGDRRIELAWAARGGREAVEMLAVSPPDVVLLDLLMHDLDGFGVLREAGYEPDSSGYEVVVISRQDDAATLEAAIAAGVAGFVSKADELSDQEICDLVCRVAAGGEGYSPVMYSRLIEARRRRRGERGPRTLSDRQLRILELEAAGVDDLDLMEEVHIARSTLTRELVAIRDLLGAATRSQAVAIALRRGLIQ